MTDGSKIGFKANCLPSKPIVCPTPLHLRVEKQVPEGAELEGIDLFIINTLPVLWEPVYASPYGAYFIKSLLPSIGTYSFSFHLQETLFP